jgi:hypothetical protein
MFLPVIAMTHGTVLTVAAADTVPTFDTRLRRRRAGNFAHAHARALPAQ